MKEHDGKNQANSVEDITSFNATGTVHLKMNIERGPASVCRFAYRIAPFFGGGDDPSR